MSEKKWFYIQWDNDFHNRPQVQEVVMELGWEAYGVFVAFTEVLHRNEGTLPLSSLRSVAWSLHVSETRLRQIIEHLLNVELLTIDGEDLVSPMAMKQFEKKERASEAANARWHKKDVHLPDTTTTTQETNKPENKPQAEVKPQAENEQFFFTDEQKKSLSLLVNKFRYSKEQAIAIARKYDYNNIESKYKYLIDRIKQYNDVKSPRAFFEKSLSENWVVNEDLIPTETQQQQQTISYDDVAVNKFLTDYKTMSKTDFPRSLIPKLKTAITNEKYSVSLVLEIAMSNWDNEKFWQNSPLTKEDFIDCSGFFSEYEAIAFIEYNASKSAIFGATVNDVFEMCDKFAM